MVIQPTDAQALGMPADRFDEKQIRPTHALVQRLLALDPALPGPVMAFTPG
ncbi:hypothetical protein [Frankia sp. EAN1pec]|uniref:hypothetical protein n=1 Tax=Parafrankia sp. (strain EAN1pec) TaxID=298653 RepID=UPI0012F92CED